jgi:hypothetical protein
MEEIPDEFTGRVQATDIASAARAVRNCSFGVIYTCPMAFALKRMFPDFRWAVGYFSVTAFPISAFTVSVQQFRLDSQTKQWIINLPAFTEWASAVPPEHDFTVTRRLL